MRCANVSPRTRHGVTLQKHLNAPDGPSRALFDIPAERFRHEPCGEDFIQIPGFVAFGVDKHARMDIFGNGLGLETHRFP